MGSFLLLSLFMGFAIDDEPGIGLRQFVQLALQRDLELQSLTLDQAVADAERRAVRWDYLPKVLPRIATSDVAGGGRIRDTGASITWNTGWGLELSGTGSWQRIEFGSNQAGSQVRELAAEIKVPLGRQMGRLSARERLGTALAASRQAQLAVDEGKQAAILRSVALYYRLLRAQKSRSLAVESVARATANMILSELKYQLGEASRIDRDRAELRLRQARSAELEAAGALEDIEITVRSEVGLQAAAGLRLTAPNVDELSNSLSFDECLALSRNHRAALQSALEQEGLAGIRYRLARRQLLPDASVVLRNSTQRSESAGVLDETHDRQIFLSADLGLDLGGRIAAVASASAAWNEARLAIGRIERDLEQETFGRLEATRRSRELLENAEALAATARRQVLIAQLRYEKGIGSAFDVVDSQAQLEEAESGLLDATITLAQRHFELLFATGQLTLEALPSGAGAPTNSARADVRGVP